MIDLWIVILKHCDPRNPLYRNLMNLKFRRHAVTGTMKADTLYLASYLA